LWVDNTSDLLPCLRMCVYAYVRMIVCLCLMRTERKYTFRDFLTDRSALAFFKQYLILRLILLYMQ
jgi:hypothetical protein